MNIGTGDELRIRHWDPEEKRRNAEYWHLKTSQTKKYEIQLSANRLYLFVFWDANCVYMTEYLEWRVIVNSSKSLEALKYLWCRLWRVRSSLVSIILQHDSVRLYTSGVTEEALENLKTEPISQPPYSPNLGSCDSLYSRMILRTIITPRTTMRGQTSGLGLEKCWERVSVIGWKRCFRVERNVLDTTVTVLKNKIYNIWYMIFDRYMILK